MQPGGTGAVDLTLMVLFTLLIAGALALVVANLLPGGLWNDPEAVDEDPDPGPVPATLLPTLPSLPARSALPALPPKPPLPDEAPARPADG